MFCLGRRNYCGPACGRIDQYEKQGDCWENDAKCGENGNRHAITARSRPVVWPEEREPRPPAAAKATEKKHLRLVQVLT